MQPVRPHSHSLDLNKGYSYTFAPTTTETRIARQHRVNELHEPVRPDVVNDALNQLPSMDTRTAYYTRYGPLRTYVMPDDRTIQDHGMAMSRPIPTRHQYTEETARGHGALSADAYRRAKNRDPEPGVQFYQNTKLRNIIVSKNVS